VVDSAIAAGINFFDTADVYGDRGGSETLLGVTLGNRRRMKDIEKDYGPSGTKSKYDLNVPTIP
jgi:predicted aldo/keto reductase-like oxidoreductase